MTPLFDSIVESKQLKQNTLTFSYLLIDERKYGFKPMLTMGYIDPQAYMGNISWFPVHIKSHFSFIVDDVLFNNKSMGICGHKEGQYCHVTMDTGTTFATFPMKAKKFMQDHKLDQT